MILFSLNEGERRVNFSRCFSAVLPLRTDDIGGPSFDRHFPNFFLFGDGDSDDLDDEEVEVIFPRDLLVLGLDERLDELLNERLIERRSPPSPLLL